MEPGDFVDLRGSDWTVCARGVWDALLPESVGRPVPTPVKFDRYIGFNPSGYLITTDLPAMFGEKRTPWAARETPGMFIAFFPAKGA